MRRHVIIGTGIAGLSAAEALRAADASADITLIGTEPHPFYSRPGLAYLLAGALPEKQLTLRTREELRELALDRRVEHATAMDVGAHTVTLSRGDPVRYDRLLLATGSAALPPDFPGHELEGVVKIDDLDDARRILRLAERARTAVVVGGGPTAVELAEGLRARGVRVHYLLRGARYFSGVLDPVESRVIEEALEHDGIELHRHTRVVRAVGERAVSAVETNRGETLPCELLAVAIGVRPRLELARAAGLALDRGVLTDARLATSAPDVYAAGDVAQAVDPETGVSRLDVLWSSALAQGRAAGRAMGGASEVVPRLPSLNVTRLGGVAVTVVGSVAEDDTEEDADLVAIARGDSEGWRLHAPAWSLRERRAASRIRVLVGEQRVVGAVVMNDARASRALTRLVRERVDISALHPLLHADESRAVARLLDFAEGQAEAARAPRA